MLKQEKNIYLLDEPFNGLDLETNKIVEQIILNLKQNGKTVFMSSHIIYPLLKICDEIHFLEKGNFIKHYSKSNFNEIEEDLFGKLTVDIQSRITTSN
jgi:ABC-2 type transport system ATP-binding protein